MTDEELWLETGVADLQAALDDIEADLPSDEVEAWLASFQEASDKSKDDEQQS